MVFRRRWRRVVAVGVVVLALAAWAQVWPFRGAKGGGHCDANERFVVDETGKRFLMSRWALDREDNLVWLRIPAEYLWRAHTGCVSAFGPNYPDPDIVGPFDTLFSLEVTLPDFTPMRSLKHDLQVRHRSESTSTIILVSSLASVPGPDKNNFENEIKKVAEDIYMNPNYVDIMEEHLTFGSKPDHFGLKRYGAIGDMVRYKDVFGGNIGKDMLYIDHYPLDMWIMCDAEEIKDHIEDSSWDMNEPQCEQHYYSITLGSDVRLDYRRIYLPRWQEWQDKTEAFLRSLPMTKANPRTD